MQLPFVFAVLLATIADFTRAETCADGASCPEPATVLFNTSFIFEGDSFPIVGMEPADAPPQSLPVFVFVTNYASIDHAIGPRDPALEFMADNRTAGARTRISSRARLQLDAIVDRIDLYYEFADGLRPMAQRGFVSAMVSTDGFCSSGTPQSANRCTTLERCARALFAYNGSAEETSTSALANLCRRPASNCSAGIAVFGFSMGGLMTMMAPHVAPITASVLSVCTTEGSNPVTSPLRNH